MSYQYPTDGWDEEEAHISLANDYWRSEGVQRFGVGHFVVDRRPIGIVTYWHKVIKSDKQFEYPGTTMQDILNGKRDEPLQDSARAHEEIERIHSLMIQDGWREVPHTGYWFSREYRRRRVR